MKVLTAAGLVLALGAAGCKEQPKAPALGAGGASAAKAAKPQETCPVMGGKIDKSIYVDHGGKRIHFCCAMCPEKFKKDPEKYLKILSDKGEVPVDAPGHHRGHGHD